MFEPLSIASMIAASFPSVRDLLLDGHQWMDPTLRKLTKEGRIRFATLGPEMQLNDGPVFDTPEISTPVVWSDKADKLSPTAKLYFVLDLLVTSLRSHENQILGFLPPDATDIRVSKQYHHAKGSTYYHDDSGECGFNFYTALCVIQ